MAKTAVNRLTVKTEGNTPYDICLKNSFSSLPQALDGIGCGGRRLCIVSDSNVADLYLKEVTEEAKKMRKRSHFLCISGWRAEQDACYGSAAL